MTDYREDWQDDVDKLVKSLKENGLSKTTNKVFSQFMLSSSCVDDSGLFLWNYKGCALNAELKRKNIADGVCSITVVDFWHKRENIDKHLTTCQFISDSRRCNTVIKEGTNFCDICINHKCFKCGEQAIKFCGHHRDYSFCVVLVCKNCQCTNHSC